METLGATPQRADGSVSTAFVVLQRALRMSQARAKRASGPPVLHRCTRLTDPYFPLGGSDLLEWTLDERTVMAMALEGFHS